MATTEPTPEQSPPAPPPPGAAAPPPPSTVGSPHGEVAGVGIRFASYLLDGLLMVVTLYIGWLIWAAITAGEGRTPGKKLLGLTVIDQATGQPITWAKYVFLRGILFWGFIAPLAFTFTLGVLALMPLWDKRNQTIVDKMSNCTVVKAA